MTIGPFARAAAGALVAGLALAAPKPAEAAFTFTIEFATGKVTGSGSLAVSTLIFVDQRHGQEALIDPLQPNLWQATGNFDVYTGLTGPAGFGGPNAGASIIFSNFSGDSVGLYGPDPNQPGSTYRLIVPAGYISGAPLSASMNFGKSGFFLDLNPGTYVWSWEDATGAPSDSLTVIVGPVPAGFGVPEPATALLLGAGLLGLVAVRRRRAAP